MAKESMDKFLSEAIADHEWLDAKDKINAPFSDYLKRDKKPELATQYTMPNLHLPVEQKPVQPIDANTGKVVVAINEVKRQMMAGKSLNHIKETIIDKLPEDVKVAAKDKLLELAKEYPLLGSVYIDASAFKTSGSVKGCEQGNELIKNSSKLAIYVKKMAACGNCSLNKGGFCRVYKKSLVENVPYNENTFSHYANHLILSNKIDYGQKIASKEDLKKAFSGEHKNTREAQSFVYHDESKLYKNANDIYQNAQSNEEKNIQRDLSLKLASGITADNFKTYVTEKYSSSYKKYPELFKKYASYLGSLGNIFIELDVFNSTKEASEFIRKYPKAKYVLSSKNQPEFVEKQLGRKVISSLKEIPLSVWKSSLKEGSYSLEELKANPLAVLKKASFEKPMIPKKASSGQEIELPNEVEIMGHNPQGSGKQFKKQKVSTYNKRETKIAAQEKSSFIDKVDIFQTGNKVAAKIDEEIEIDLEPAEFDESVKKYL